MADMIEVSQVRTTEIIEIIVRDSSGQKLDRFKCNDRKTYRRILAVIKDKYGYEPTLEPSDSFFEF